MTVHVLALVGLLLSAEGAQAGLGPHPLANRWFAPRQPDTTAAWVLPSLFGGPAAGKKVGDYTPREAAPLTVSAVSVCNFA